MRIRRTLTIGLLALCALWFTSSIASAGVLHEYLTQISEVPAEPGIFTGPIGRPSGIATDAAGNVYITDAEDSVIDEYNSSNEFVKQISGGPPASHEFASIAVNDATGEIYATGVGPESNQVYVYSATGALLDTWTGTDTPDGGFAGRLYVAVDNSKDPATDPAAGDVYVSSCEQGTVFVFKPETGGKEKYVTELTGTNTPNGTFGGEDSIAGVAVNNTNGDLVVTNARLKEEFDMAYVFSPQPSGEYKLLFQLEGNRQKLVTFGSDIREIEDAAVDNSTTDGSNGNIYIEEKNAKTVYEFTPSGKLIGEYTGTPNGEFIDPRFIAIGPTGNLYVADSDVEDIGTSNGISKVVDVFGADITIPDVSTAPPSAGLVITLKGTVSPDGTSISNCQFEYGVTSAYGRTVPCAMLPGASTSPVPASANLDPKNLEPGATYHYRLAATNTEHHTVYGDDEELFSPPAAVGSLSTSNVTSFAATLTGVIEPGGFTPEYHFVYGPTTAYGSRIPQTDAGAGLGGPQTVNQNLTGLQPETTYHYALVTTNFGGVESIGPDQTFTTRPLVPPAVNTGDTETIAQTTATLTGSVNPEGLPTTYHFEYGPTTAYGSTWPLVQVFAGTGSTPQGVAVAIPNLQPGAAYHYRLVATNEDGTTYGPDQTFATPAYPVSIVQEPTTLPTIKAPAVKTKKAPAKKVKKKTKSKKRSKKRGKAKKK